MYFVYFVAQSTRGTQSTQFLRTAKPCTRKENFVDQNELELLCDFLCAAYDGKPITIHKTDNGRIIGVDVHEDGEHHGN